MKKKVKPVIKKKKPAMKKKVVAPKVQVKSSKEEQVIAPIEDDATREDQFSEMAAVHIPTVKMTNNLTRMSVMNRQVEYVMAFKPEIQRNADGSARCLIGVSAITGLVTEGVTVHEAIIRMSNLLTE